MPILSFLIGILSGVFLACLWFSLQIRIKIARAVSEWMTKAQITENKASALLEQNLKNENSLEQLRRLLGLEREAKTAAMTRLEESLKNVEEQRKVFEESQEQFKGIFGALSAEALKSNNQAFLDLASRSLEGVLKIAKGEIGEKTGEIKNVIAPLEKALEHYAEQVSALEKTRAQAYGSLENQIESLVLTQQLLQKETGNLVSALRTPHVRGQWGQISLRRVVELAGMTEHCDYTEQVSVKTEEGRLQPDMLIHLPGSREVVVDSKVSLAAYLEYIEAVDESAKRAALLKHGQQIRKHMNDLASKAYWSQFPKAPEFVIMFIPGESFLSAAVENDPALIEDGISNRVIVATPLTLITLLRAIAYGWRQEQVAKNAQAIADLGRQVYERFGAFLGHLSKMRESLEQSVFNFNRTIGSLEGRILPGLRKFRDLGATGADELPSIEPLEQTPRTLEFSENKSAGEHDPRVSSL